jgi:hypothetical protein
MAAITGCTTKQVAPNSGVLCFLITTPDSADSADTIDVSSATATGGQTVSTIYAVMASDTETGDNITATWSGTTVTLDAAGGTTDKTYTLLVWGK